jgi:hypothetical protein
VARFWTGNRVGFATLVLLRRVTPEILIVGDPAGRRPLADAIAASGYGVALCSPRELNRRVRTNSPPTAIVACIGDLDPDMLLAGLRRTRAGASIPVILYGRLGGALRDLADVLDIGADHFIEEPAAAGEFEDALMQYAGPPREREDERGRSDRRPPPRRDEPSRGPSPRAHTDRLDERPRAERGKALGELHRTLDRLEAQLRADDPRSDPELAELGFDGIPDVDPPDEPLPDEEPSSTGADEPAHGRERGRERERGRDDERPRPRSPQRDAAAPTSRSDRARDPDEETGPGRRSWRDDPSEASGRIDHTRPWTRPESEGPLRRDREPPSSMLGSRPGRQPSAPPEDSARSRSSAVLRARRPDRDEPARPRESPRTSEPDRDAAREKLRELLRPGEAESSRGTGRFGPGADPHARDSPWPTDFDPSESTMIRRERGDATTRRRSLGNTREFPWGRGSEGAEHEPSPARRRGSSEAEQPARSPTHVRPRPPEPRREPEPEQREPEPPPSPPRTRRTARPRAAVEPRPSSLQIDPSLRESGKLGPDVDVPALLWALHDQRFTGKLRLTRQRIEKQIWLRDGEAVFARSTATSDRLVDGLLRRGVLTRPQYETARRLAAKEPRRAGELLVDAGFLKARELDVLLRDHLARVIDSAFEWTDGAWSTEPGERTDEPIQLEVPMAAMILDGVRYRCDASELEDRLTRRTGSRGPLVPRLRTGAELGEDPTSAISATIEELREDFRLLPEEESWLRRFDGRHGVAALLADGADEQALFALLFTLDLAGHVDLREQPEPLVASDRDPAALDSERILERLRLAREADYFELLGVGRDAARSEIRQAFTELHATFADDAIEEASRRRHSRELREVRSALEEARDILVDDAMRSAYLAHLGDD